VNARRGKFIVLEGVDGSGKTTQAFLLSKHLGEERMRVHATREPGGSATGEKIREILLDPGAEELSAECELLLYMASRAQHVEKEIIPALESGAVVVCERFTWSSLAYQGYAGGLPIADVERIAEFAVKGFEPDVTILLDVDPEIAYRREALVGAEREYDRIERRGVAFQQKVRKGFLELAEREGANVYIVDASRPAKAVHEEVRRIIKNVL
jgi:dTMP kinase